MGSWGSADFKQLQKLRENIEKMDKNRQQFCEECAKELAGRLLALVIPRTPVGKRPHIEGSKRAAKAREYLKSGQTLHTMSKQRYDEYWSGYMGGTLRRGWTAKTEGEAQSGSGRGSVGAGKEYAQSLPVSKAGGSYTVTVINPVKYASYVEFGHRQKPGRYVPALGKQLKASWVKGKYMLTISEKQLDKMAPGILEKKLQAFLTEVFNG